MSVGPEARTTSPSRLGVPLGVLLVLLAASALLALRRDLFGTTLYLGVILLATAGIAARLVRRERSLSAAARRSEERYHLLFDSSPLPMWLFDVETLRFLAVNDAAVRHYGYSREDFLQMTVKDLRPPEDVPRLLAHLAQPELVVSPGELWRHRKKDGTIIDVEIYSHRVDFAGRPASLVIVSDVGERRQAEQALRERSRELEALNQELEAFSYSVSHDLRSPLRHLAGFARILEEDYGAGLDEKARGHLRRIVDGARHMGDLIDDLLKLSRLGRRPLERGPTDLGALVQEARQEVEAEMPERRIDWRVERLPRVECDRGLVRQVFVNLLSNAVKYSRPRPRSEVEVGTKQQDGATVFYVRDNGVGFDMKYAHKLFGVFQRLHGVAHFEGTGVGLATVQRIVQKHGGRAWAESAVDRGATFYFTLEPARGAQQPRSVVAGQEESEDARRSGSAAGRG